MSKKNKNCCEGRIFDIQRFSIHDGPGIRTTVFFKGCPLNCAWCHNPESISSRPVLSFLPDKCIGCGYCFKVCPQDAHIMSDGKHLIDRTKCTACGLCTRECYSRAIELVGKTVTVEEVMASVLADKTFYENSGGGMTVSGGEPLTQPKFCSALLQEAKSQGIHCCCDTCGYVKWEFFQKILGLVDMFLFDVKDTNPLRHKTNTGVDNKLIQENLRKLHDAGATIRIRIPLIPGLNDAEDNLACLLEMLKKLPNIQAVEIMPYHKLGVSKIDRFGLEARPVIEKNPPTVQEIRRWKDTLELSGVTIIKHDEQNEL